MPHPDPCANRNRPRRALPTTALLATAGLLLSACTTGPDFRSPADATASAYQVAVPQGVTASNPGPAGEPQSFVVGKPIASDWYTLFQSVELNALIHQALANNPTLQASQASLRQAAYQLEAVIGSDLPDVDLGASISRKRGSGAQLGLDSPMFTGNIFNLYQGSVALSYDLDLFGATARETEAQQARVAYARNQLRGSMLTLVDNVVITTVRYAALRDRLATLQNIIAAEQSQVALLGKQEQAGAVAWADVLRAQAQLADTLAQLPALRHRLATTEHALARLVAADPGRFQAPPLSLRDFKLPAELPISLSSSLVRQRPDILAAEQMMHAANAEVGVATAHLYPNINLTASLGTIANHPGDLFEAPSKIWSLGGALTAPLFHGGTLRANRDAAKAAWAVSYARYKGTVLDAFTQVADVLDAIQRDAATLKARNAALHANRDSLELVRKQYRAGATAYIDVLIAERRYNQAVAAHIDAVRQRYVDTASLYHALGGGWWNPAHPEPENPQQQSGDNTHG